MAYHLAAALIGRQFLQPFLFAIQYANPRGAIYLMTTEDKEITIQRLHVHPEMGRALRAIHQYRHAMGMRHPDDVGHGIDRTQ